MQRVLNGERQAGGTALQGVTPSERKLDHTRLRCQMKKSGIRWAERHREDLASQDSVCTGSSQTRDPLCP